MGYDNNALDQDFHMCRTILTLVTGLSIHANMVTHDGTRSVKFFSKLNNFFLGYFDPIHIFFDNKNKYFSG